MCLQSSEGSIVSRPWWPCRFSLYNASPRLVSLSVEGNGRQTPREGAIGTHRESTMGKKESTYLSPKPGGGWGMATPDFRRDWAPCWCSCLQPLGWQKHSRFLQLRRTSFVAHFKGSLRESRAYTKAWGWWEVKMGCPFTAVFCLNVFPLLIGRPFPTVKPQLPRNTNLIYRFLFVKKLWYEYASLAGAERDPGGLWCSRNFTVTN